MKLENYFKIILEIENVFKIKNIDIKFNQLIMKSEEEETIIFNNIHSVFTIEPTSSNIAYLYIHNNGTEIKDRIDYLLDEDWIIEKLDISVVEKNVQLPFIIKGYQQISSFDFLEEKGIISDFLNKKYVNNTICILGPKPNFLYGYNMNDIKYAYLKQKIIEKIEPLISIGKNIILTNGYIGGETIGFQVGLQMKQNYKEIQNVLAIPFLNLDKKWVAQSQLEFNEMKKKADAFIEIDKIPNYKYGESEIYIKEKLIKKNDFDVDFASIFVVINDDKDTLKSIKRQIQYNNKILIEIDAFKKNTAF